MHLHFVPDLRQILSVKLFEWFGCLSTNHHFIELGTLLSLDITHRVFLEQLFRIRTFNKVGDREFRVDELLLIKQAAHHVCELSLPIELHVGSFHKVELVYKID